MKYIRQKNVEFSVFLGSKTRLQTRGNTQSRFLFNYIFIIPEWARKKNNKIRDPIKLHSHLFYQHAIAAISNTLSMCIIDLLLTILFIDMVAPKTPNQVWILLFASHCHVDMGQI